MKRILVVDDEPSIVTLLTFNLEKEGYHVDTSLDGKDGFEKALTNDYDFIVLDLMLPSLDGVEITKKLRREKVDTPILMLTAKDDPVDKIIGLEIGADDYLTKPFSPRELVARIKGIFRREEIILSQASSKTSENAEEEALELPVLPPIQIGGIHVDQNNFQVFVHGDEVILTPKEYELLVYFMKRSGRIISREILLERIWDFAFAGESRIVDVHISHLREKIEANPKSPKYLVTIRGFGYRFNQLEEK